MSDPMKPVPVAITFDSSLEQPTGDVMLCGDRRLLDVYQVDLSLSPASREVGAFYAARGRLKPTDLNDDGDIDLSKLERVVITNATITINGEIDPAIAERIVPGITVRSA